MGDSESRPRAFGWLAHLRSGGSTPWQEWHGEGVGSGRVPGAQHLELLRRANEQGLGLTRAEDILSARLVGRGLGEVTLLGEPHSGWGDPPMDPALLPERELVRVAADLLGTTLNDAGAWLERPLEAVWDAWR